MARLDLFPATVTTPRGTHRRARIYVADDGTAIVWIRGPGKSADVAEHATADVADSRHALARRREWDVQTTEGETWTVVRDGSCGCGNPLKNMRPERELAALAGT